MIFEVTRDYTIIVPLMISNLIAFFISQHWQREPIYEALARQDGVHLPTGEHQARRTRLRVARAMRPAADETLSPKTSVADALDHRAASTLDAWPVLDGGQLQGMVERRELERALAAGRGDQALVVFLRERSPPHGPDALPHVHPDHGLTLALERMGALRRTVLPVVSRSDIRHLLGVVTLEDVLEAYGVERSRAGRSSMTDAGPRSDPWRRPREPSWRRSPWSSPLSRRCSPSTPSWREGPGREPDGGAPAVRGGRATAGEGRHARGPRAPAIRRLGGAARIRPTNAVSLRPCWRRDV